MHLVHCKCAHKAFSPRLFHGYCLKEFIITQEEEPLSLSSIYTLSLSSSPIQISTYKFFVNDTTCDISMLIFPLSFQI